VKFRRSQTQTQKFETDRVHKLTVLPVYFLCDELSMKPDSLFDLIKDSMNEIVAATFFQFEEIHLLISMLCFGDEKSLHLSLRNVQSFRSLSDCQVSNCSNFGDALRTLRQAIDFELTNLKKDSQVIRPTVILVGVSQLTQDDFQNSLAELLGFKFRPNMIDLGAVESNGQIIDVAPLLLAHYSRINQGFSSQDVTVKSVLLDLYATCLNQFFGNVLGINTGIHLGEWQMTFVNRERLGALDSWQGTGEFRAIGRDGSFI